MDEKLTYIPSIQSDRRRPVFQTRISDEWAELAEQFRKAYMPTLKISEALSHIHNEGMDKVSKMIMLGEKIETEKYREPNGRQTFAFRRDAQIDAKFRELADAMPVEKTIRTEAPFIRIFLAYGFEAIKEKGLI